MSDRPWNWSTQEAIRTRLGAGRAFLRRILDRLAEQQWSQRDMFAVQLAVDEALANAIKHGNRMDESKHVQVACKISHDRIWIRICDQGPGFDPGSVPDATRPENLSLPSGRGVLLMRRFMTRVEYQDDGRVVVMEKERKDAGSAEAPDRQP